MFQFRPFPSYTYLIQCTMLEYCSSGFPPYTYGFSIRSMDMSPWGFPHSDICGSRLICSSPQLFAAYHVFLRLLVPRHPPCALISLTILQKQVFALQVCKQTCSFQHSFSQSERFWFSYGWYSVITIFVSLLSKAIIIAFAFVKF